MLFIVVQKYKKPIKYNRNLLWIHVGNTSNYQWHQGMSKMSVHHKTYFSQPRNDWLCIFSNYCAFLKTTGLSLCTRRIIMIYELFLLQLLSRHMICVAGIKSINILLKMGVRQTRYIKHIMWDTCCVVENQSRAYCHWWSLERMNKRFVVSCINICACKECTFCMKKPVLLMERKETVVWSLAVFPFAPITYRNLVLRLFLRKHGSCKAEIETRTN